VASAEVCWTAIELQTINLNVHRGNQRNSPHGTFIMVMFLVAKRLTNAFRFWWWGSCLWQAVPCQHKTEKKKRLGLTLTTAESNKEIGIWTLF